MTGERANLSNETKNAFVLAIKLCKIRIKVMPFSAIAHTSVVCICLYVPMGYLSLIMTCKHINLSSFTVILDRFLDT